MAHDGERLTGVAARMVLKTLGSPNPERHRRRGHFQKKSTHLAPRKAA
jgi:hypothetical protein